MDTLQQESNLLSYWVFLIVITFSSPTCIRLINLTLSAIVYVWYLGIEPSCPTAYAAASPVCLTVPLSTVPDSNRLWNAIKALTLQIVIYHTNAIVFSLTPNLLSSDPVALPSLRWFVDQCAIISSPSIFTFAGRLDERRKVNLDILYTS